VKGKQQSVFGKGGGNRKGQKKGRRSLIQKKEESIPSMGKEKEAQNIHTTGKKERVRTTKKKNGG